MKQTILYIGGFELPDKNAAAHRVKSNGKIFEELGYLVKYRGLYEVNRSSNIYDIKRPKSFIEWINYSVGSKSVIDMLNEDNSIVAVVLYNYPAIAQARIISYCSKKKIKVISDCTEWYSTKNYNNLIMKIIKGLDTFLRMKIVNKLSDGIIVISTYLEKYYSDLDTILIPPLVDVQNEKWSIKNNNSSKSSNEVIFTYAGSPGNDKDDITGIIQILNELDSSKVIVLQIIGVDEGEINTPQISNNEKFRILFKGRLSHEETLNLIAKSTYYIFFRMNNRVTNAGFPTKFVEGVTLGIPVITNNISDIKEYIDRYNIGILVDNQNLSESKHILQSLINNEIIIKSNPEVFDYRNHTNKMEIFLKKIIKDD